MRIFVVSKKEIYIGMNNIPQNEQIKNKKMSTKITTKEVKAFTKKEATENKEIPFSVLKDATAAWKNAGCPFTNKVELKAFFDKYLTAHTKNIEGVGCFITVIPGSADTRNRPFTITNVKTTGSRKFGRVFKLIDESNGQILKSVKGTKAEAQAAAKKLINDGFKGKGKIVVTQEVTEGEPIVTYFEYTPSKSAKMGQYLFFGIESTEL